MNISKSVRNEEKYIVNLRRYFHAHPEASLKEYNTANKIEEELKALNIPYERVGETGVIGYIGNPDKGKTLALRADIDALEIEEANDVEYRSLNKGLMHACGHDAHTASLLGAAKVLKGKEDEINGYVKLIFQQAEEIGQGARQFIAAGHLKDVDNVFGLHLSSELETGKIAVRPGPVAASCDYFKIKITGKSSHVSKPHTGIDALYIASQVVVNLQSIVSRETDPIDTVVVGIGVLNSGTRYNIVARDAVLEGTFRTFSKESRSRTQEAFASPVINHEASSLLAAKVARNIVGEDNVITNQEKALGADDFAEFQAVVPGVYAYVGSRNPHDEGSHYPHHNERFNIDEKCLLVATELYIQYALEYLDGSK